MTVRRRSARTLAAAAVAMAAAAGVVACTGEEGPASSTTSTDPVPSAEELQYPAFSDPAVPVTVEVGRRFAIMVPANPAEGWRWIVEPVDTRLLAPLGSEFREDPELLAAATTTTTAPPPPEDTATTQRPGSTASSSTTAPSTTVVETTTTTAPGPLVQIVSYAGRADGITTVALRYERIGTDGGADGEADDEVQRLVFTVFVGEVVLPTPDTGPPPG